MGLAVKNTGLKNPEPGPNLVIGHMDFPPGLLSNTLRHGVYTPHTMTGILHPLTDLPLDVSPDRQHHGKSPYLIAGVPPAPGPLSPVESSVNYVWPAIPGSHDR